MNDHLHNSKPPGNRLEQALAAYIRAVDQGEPIDQEDLIGEYPEVAIELREFFADSESLESLFQNGDDGATEHSPEPLGSIKYFGDYELIEEIARGGMGIVYLARQVSLDRLVAVKVILAGRLASDTDIQRFHRETRLAAVLRHPGIVRVFEVGSQDGQHYFSMEYIPGQSLATVVKDGPMAASLAAKYARQVALAVEHAHQAGILHRDIKPSNVLLTEEGEPVVTDFGLAKLLGRDSDVTGSDDVLGTPSYMSPEQAAARHLDIGPATDVYSIGAVLYESLTGRAPFRADTPVATILQVLESDPATPRLLNPTIPLDLETICLKCLEKDPHNRYRSSQDLANDLDRFINKEPIQARPISWLERTWRWCRRNPAVTGLLTMVLVASAAGVGIWSHLSSTVTSYQDKALQARADVSRLDNEKAELETAERNARLEQSRKQIEIFRQRASEDVQHGWSVFDSGDKSGALLWFSNGLRNSERATALAAKNAELVDVGMAHIQWEARVNRIRVERLLRKYPLIGTWWNVRAAAVSENGEWLAIVVPDDSEEDSQDGKISILSVTEGTLIQSWRYSPSEKMGSDRPRLAFSPDGSYLAAFHRQGVHLWEVSTSGLLASIDETVWHAFFVGDGRELLVVSGKELIWWDVSTATKLRSQNLGDARFLAVSPDRRGIAFVQDAEVHVLKTSTGDRVAKLPCGREVREACFSENALRLLIKRNIEHAVGTGWLIEVWDVARGQRIADFNSEDISSRKKWVSGSRMAISPDGSHVAILVGQGEITLFSADTGQQTRSVLTHQGATTTQMEFVSDSRLLAASCGMRPAVGVFAWNVQTGDYNFLPMLNYSGGAEIE